jgi:hypothetical protein
VRIGISPSQLLSDLTVLVLSGNLDGIQRSPSSFFSVNFYCARFLQCACFLQCCSSCAFTSKSPNSAYPAISVVAIKDNNHQHAFVACSIFANSWHAKGGLCLSSCLLGLQKHLSVVWHVGLCHPSCGLLALMEAQARLVLPKLATNLYLQDKWIRPPRISSQSIMMSKSSQ